MNFSIEDNRVTLQILGLLEASGKSQGRSPKSSPLRLGIRNVFNRVPGVMTTVKAIM